MVNWQVKVHELVQKKLSIWIEKDGQTLFQSTDSMLKPLLDCLNSDKKYLQGSTVIDKVTGLAAAYLCQMGGVKEIFTPLTSEAAIDFLKKSNIEIKALQTIPRIMNRTNSGLCPMEQMALSSASAEDFYQKLNNRGKSENG